MRTTMPQTQFFYFGVKSGLQRFLCFVLVISLLSFRTQTPQTSVYIPDMVPYSFSQSIGREASSLEGELRCNQND
uniref:Uncharacterized protein n=1 Tax=Cucumis melo TaxID=3656 RepID=A0A9I9E9G4_CUCME